MPSHDRTHTLVLDTAPLLTSNLTSLLTFSNRFVTTRDVIEEVRGKGQRERLEREWKTLDAVTGASGSQPTSSDPEWQGLQVRLPSANGIAKIKEFARKTGDIAVLSSVDIGVLALAYDVEVEANGTWRLRNDVGGKRQGKDPEKKKARLLRKQPEGAQAHQAQSTSHEEKHPENRSSEKSTVGFITSQTAQISIDETPAPDAQQPCPTSSDCGPGLDYVSAQPPLPINPPQQAQSPSSDTATDLDWVQVPTKLCHKKDDDDDSEISSCASEFDSTWITPENLHIHQAKDLGFFPALNDPAKAALLKPSDSQVDDEQGLKTGSLATGDSLSKAPTMKAALLTGDYAMQNVALQLGLNVLGVGGKRIRDVKTWVLRCYGCFKLCKDATRKFCPNCGGATLTRVSITYTPTSPTGYILHLKANYQHRNRGTVYSIPSTKIGSASFEKKAASKQKGINGATLILREDQKEFQEGLKTVKIQKMKEERQLAKANREQTDQDGKVFNIGRGWNDPDWEPPMLMGEKGRRGNGRNQTKRDVRFGKDGMPLIGFGRNPNEARRKI